MTIPPSVRPWLGLGALILALLLSGDRLMLSSPEPSQLRFAHTFTTASEREILDDAIAEFEAQAAWRAGAATLIPGLEAYLTGTADTIGARQQPRLSREQALHLAACTAAHRDISLNF